MIAATDNTKKVKALYHENPSARALYRRFLDLPKSERDQMVRDLEESGDYWHFKTYLCDRGNNLANTKAGVAAIIGKYLGVTVEQLAANNVQFVPYAEFSKTALA